jgi:hypothetical protein
MTNKKKTNEMSWKFAHQYGREKYRGNVEN